MNRVIKFRVWHTGIKKMLYPPLAYDSSNHCRDIEGNIIEFIPKNKKQHNSKFYFEAEMDWKGRWYEDGELQNAIFLQFTGLFDKNGREIYEGDILKIEEWDRDDLIAKVIFCERNVGFRVATGSGVVYENFPSSRYLQVIGNIFENPELLK